MRFMRSDSRYFVGGELRPRLFGEGKSWYLPNGYSVRGQAASLFVLLKAVFSPFTIQARHARWTLASSSDLRTHNLSILHKNPRDIEGLTWQA